MRLCAHCELPIHLYLASWVDECGWTYCPARSFKGDRGTTGHRPPALDTVLRDLVRVLG